MTFGQKKVIAEAGFAGTLPENAAHVLWRKGNQVLHRFEV